MITLIILIYSIIALIVGLGIKYVDEKYEVYFIDGDKSMLGLISAIWPISLFFIVFVVIVTCIGKSISWVYGFLEDKFTK